MRKVIADDFAAAEDAVQDALLEAHRSWGDTPPDDPKGWLLTVAGRKLIDARRADVARRRREEAVSHEPAPGPAGQADDTLVLLFLCCHPSLSPASAIALTLRAVGGLTTRQIAEAFLVPETTMAQRISRAKRTVAGQPFTEPGDVAVVMHVLYLIFNEGYSGRIDLSAEAIRLTRQLALACDEPEVAGLLALMLLHHARHAARTGEHGDLIPLDRQDRARWNRAEIAEGVHILQAALASDRRGEYQIQAAIAELHDDAATAAETDWPQILAWYDELTEQPAGRAQPGGRGRRGRRPAGRAGRRRGPRAAAGRPSPPRCRARPPARTGRPPRPGRRPLHPRRHPGQHHPRTRLPNQTSSPPPPPGWLRTAARHRARRRSARPDRQVRCR